MKRGFGLFLLSCLLPLLWSCWPTHLSAAASTTPSPAAVNQRPQDATSVKAPADKPATKPEDPRQLARQVLDLNQKVMKLFELKDYARCARLLEQLITLAPDDNVAWYNLACTYSRLNQPREAITALNKAVDLGYAYILHMEQDQDLNAIHDTDGYKALLARKDDIQRKRAEKIEAQLQTETGKDYICDIDHERKLVFATNIDRRTLNEVKAQLTAEAAALWADLFDHKPEQYLTVIIPSEKDAAKLSPMIGGYFQQETNRLVARQIGITLRHEFTHAMHWGDQCYRGQSHQLWVSEGLAGLMESATFTGGHIHPQPNTRLNMLQAIIQAKKALPWKDLFKTTPRQFMSYGAISYPETRYVMMYFFQKGKLRQWYLTYCKLFDKDPNGVQATEAVFGKKLADVEADWKKWVMSLTAPPVRPDKTYMGVRVAGAPDGIKIVEVLPDSGAADAGLKIGDVILKAGGQRIVDNEKLLEFVAKQTANSLVTVEYRRDGKYLKTRVKIKAVPADLKPAPRPRK